MHLHIENNGVIRMNLNWKNSFLYIYKIPNFVKLEMTGVWTSFIMMLNRQKVVGYYI